MLVKMKVQNTVFCYERAEKPRCKRYTKLYTPLLPQKDEMEMWLGAKMDTDLLEMLEEHMEKDMKIDLETTDKSKTALIYDEHNTKQDRCVKRNVCRRSLKCKK